MTQPLRKKNWKLLWKTTPSSTTNEDTNVIFVSYPVTNNTIHNMVDVYTTAKVRSIN